MPSKLLIVVTGLITQHPRLGGITWHYLQYLLGLARLGHEVYYVEDSGEFPYEPEGGTSEPECVAKDCRDHVGYLAKVMSRFGLDGRWAYRFPLESRWYGLSSERRRNLLAAADLLINVSGTLERPEEYRCIPRLAYVDTDPVVTQAKIAGGRRTFRKRVAAHDVHFSFGEHFTDAVPSTGHRWLPTRQPIVLSEWPPFLPSRDAFTTVMNWTSYEPLRYAGRAYGQKDVEFTRFLELPGEVAPLPLEVALNGTQHQEWEGRGQELPPRLRAWVGTRGPLSPRELLAHAGWRVVDADRACGDLDRYREYIQSSKAEWSVAKNAYVRGRPGWFSERSACYLASGRPVVVQDTGFSAALPVGEGILKFRNPEEAAAAIREVEAGYERHAKAARGIAEECFDSDKVLSRLVREAMDAS